MDQLTHGKRVAMIIAPPSILWSNQYRVSCKLPPHARGWEKAVPLRLVPSAGQGEPLFVTHPQLLVRYPLKDRASVIRRTADLYLSNRQSLTLLGEQLEMREGERRKVVLFRAE